MYRNALQHVLQRLVETTIYVKHFRSFIFRIAFVYLDFISQYYRTFLATVMDVQPMGKGELGAF